MIPQAVCRLLAGLLGHERGHRWGPWQYRPTLDRWNPDAKRFERRLFSHRECRRCGLSEFAWSKTH